ncbi:disease resistance protein At4g27190-like [Henckelia pumila]|uniref:disease resistance protein At4g27190-like n=1 Tax=Henckelia pumila TaxID=405737 RepID=UPI003C6E0FC8
MIAICGPGGVGKTTMVRRIEDMAGKENLFDEIVHVVVSQQIDLLQIHKEIAALLHLPLPEDSLAIRAHNNIRIRLMDSKRKLIIFDDVWKRFNLNHLGVPSGNGSTKRCKIILTSRLKDVCEAMDADKVFQIKVLDDQESWRLFREKSGIREDDSQLRPIAEAFAAECKGLPIALVHIARALKNKPLHTWEDSLLQLKRANPTNFSTVLEDVYKPLKLSYDFLENESEKSIFLLCCLFPEDNDIPIELLTLYSIGLGILERISNIQEGRNRTHHLVERLKN